MLVNLYRKEFINIDRMFAVAYAILFLISLFVMLFQNGDMFEKVFHNRYVYHISEHDHSNVEPQRTEPHVTL